MSSLLSKLEKALKGQAKSVSSTKDRRYRVTVESENIVNGAKILFDDFESRFMTATCVDEGLDFSILYHFDIGGEVVTLGTSIPKEDPRLQSISLAVPTAQWIEREITDLFGVNFEGHPQPEGLIAAEGWAGETPPLQKPREGDIVPEYRGAIENVISTGAVVSLSSFTKRKREEAGLAPTTITIEDEEGREELHKILKRSKVDERAGFDWKKKKLRYK
jgi:Ni,Fe-hydrogenase III component G